MRKILLSIFALGLSIGATALPTLTIANTDMKWTVGNEWYMSVSSYTLPANPASVSEWDFTGYEASLTNDTVKAVTSPEAGSVVQVYSDIVSKSDFQNSGSDYKLAKSVIEGIAVIVDNPLPLGFPRSDGSSWSNSSTTLFGFGPTASLTGSVLSQGVVKTSYGIYTALFIEETVTTTAGSFTYYYWETKEFGRIATLIKGKLSVMIQNNFNPVSTVSTQEVQVNKVNVYPNPASNNFTIQSNQVIGQVKVFNALGTLVANQNVNNTTVSFDVANWNAGMYFVQTVNNGKVSTTSVIVK